MRSGYRLSWSIHDRRFKDSVSFGQSLIEKIYLGADWSMMFIAREYSMQQAREAAWPWGTVANVGMSRRFPARMGKVGRRGSSVAGQLYLSAVAGTTAQTQGAPATLCAKHALFAGASSLTFDALNRELMIRLDLLPYEPYGTLEEDEEGNLPDGAERANLQRVWFETT